MPYVKTESLQSLRQRVNLPDLLSGYLELKRYGSSYKALCPFHDEKTPSFIVKPGDSHYHCFGCGAHGDAITFLMTYLKMNFADAIELLAQKFNVHLEYTKDKLQKGPSKQKLRQLNAKAACFYHFYLLHSEEGVEALKYLYSRGLDLDFIRGFHVGLAPCQGNFLMQWMLHEKASMQDLTDLALVRLDSRGKPRDFFQERILFPIKDYLGSVIGFSGRKYRENTFGGKYINSPETELFKKSRTLYGLNYCRRTIAKEQKALIVEGQIDALRLIQEGLRIVVAPQGTAFGIGHREELMSLGVKQVWLAFDGDEAGSQACVKIGDLFQSKGIDVYIVPIPQKVDPDLILRMLGMPFFMHLVEKKEDYLTYLVKFAQKNVSSHTPAIKAKIFNEIAKKISSWEDSLMIHESLKRLSQLLGVPEEMLPQNSRRQRFRVYPSLSKDQVIDADKVLEEDLLRCLILQGKKDTAIIELVGKYLQKSDLYHPLCRTVFEVYFKEFEKNTHAPDILDLAVHFKKQEEEVFFSNLLQKKINFKKAQENVKAALKGILERNWLRKKEKVNQQIREHSLKGLPTEELLKTFDRLNKNPPSILCFQ